MKLFIAVLVAVAIVDAVPILPLGGGPMMMSGGGIFDLLSGLGGGLMMMGDDDVMMRDMEMRFDMTQQKWTVDCTNVTDDSCPFGVNYDDGNPEVCPSCYLGADQTCGKWHGECGSEFKCRHDDPTAPQTGRCVPASSMSELGEGERCGSGVGECRDGLRCQHEADPFNSGHVVSSGVCVTKERFESREEGETCGDEVGKCAGDLVCSNSHNFIFAQKYCHRPDPFTMDSATGDNGGFEFMIEFDAPQGAFGGDFPFLQIIDGVLGEVVGASGEDLSPQSSKAEEDGEKGAPQAEKEQVFEEMAKIEEDFIDGDVANRKIFATSALKNAIMNSVNEIDDRECDEFMDDVFWE